MRGVASSCVVIDFVFDAASAPPSAWSLRAGAAAPSPRTATGSSIVNPSLLLIRGLGAARRHSALRVFLLVRLCARAFYFRRPIFARLSASRARDDLFDFPDLWLSFEPFMARAPAFRTLRSPPTRLTHGSRPALARRALRSASASARRSGSVDRSTSSVP